jgi:phosphoenolpyruvate carboxykinase (ATP)
MLTCDAFGVMPPVARLSVEQAVFHFLSGYTAKVAGTEVGIKEPQATFSACFGAPFMALPPTVYAHLLMKKIREHDARCWLVNTGWAGKPYGEGERIPIRHSRAIVKAIVSGALEEAEYETDPVFGLRIPKAVEGVPPQILNPRNAASDTEAYDARARKLAGDFRKNFASFEKDVPQEVLEKGVLP